MSAQRAKGSGSRAVAQKLESLKLAGVSHLPKAKTRSKKPAVVAEERLGSAALPSRAATAAAIGRSAPAATPAGGGQRPAATLVKPSSLLLPDEAVATPLSVEQKQSRLAVVRKEVEACTRCSALCRTRTQTVFGVGNVGCRICFVGEAPGADEDRQGEPFVGRAGQLLNKIIEACTLKREDVYILNILKCRPPDNRTPLPDEVANCRGYLDRQLEIIRPEFLVCLGAVAATTLLESTKALGKLRGTFHDYRGIPVLATYHPAYLLRNPPAKKDTWEDMQLLMKRAGIKLPK